jgi:hypothetical protein
MACGVISVPNLETLKCFPIENPLNPRKRPVKLPSATIIVYYFQVSITLHLVIQKTPEWHTVPVLTMQSRKQPQGQLFVPHSLVRCIPAPQI